MKRRMMAAVVVSAMAGVAGAQVGSTFTYQGQLTSGGSPVSGPVDIRFRLFDAATGGNADRAGA